MGLDLKGKIRFGSVLWALTAVVASVTAAARAENSATFEHPILQVFEYARTAPSRIDEGTLASFRETVTKATGDPKLLELMREPGFRKRFIQANRDALGPLGNLDATKVFYEKTGLDAVLRMFPDDVPLLNQVYFAKPRAPEDLALYKKRFAEFGFEEKDVLVDPRAELKDGKLYHGTDRPQLDGIIQSGAAILPGGRNARGIGVYGVARKQLGLAWYFGKFIAEFDVSPQARMLDNGGNGALLAKRYWEKNPGSHLDTFTDYFGIDILKHRRGTIEFVAKNPAVLERPKAMGAGYEGFASLAQRATNASSAQRHHELLMSLAAYGPLTGPQLALIVDLLPKPTRLRSYFEQIDRMGGVDPAARLKFKHFGILFDLLFEFADKGGAEFSSGKTATVLGEYLKAFLWDFREFSQTHAAAMSETVLPLLQRLYLLKYPASGASGLEKLNKRILEVLKTMKATERRAYLRQLIGPATHEGVLYALIFGVGMPIVTALPVYVLSKFVEINPMSVEFVIAAASAMVGLASTILELSCEMGAQPAARFCQDTKRIFGDFDRSIKSDPELCNAMLTKLRAP